MRICLFILLFTLWGVLSHGAQAQESELHGPPLKIENVDQVARDILDLYDASSEKYGAGDGLSLTLYILRTFAVAGEYDLSGKDLQTLVRTFEELVGEPLAPEIHFILEGIALIKFREIGGLPTAIFVTTSPAGIRYPLNQTFEDSSVKEIKDLVIVNGASVAFDRVNGPNDRAALSKFVLDKIKIFPLPQGWFDALNQINPEIENNIKKYLNEKVAQENGPYPLKLTFSGFTLNVVTSTIFKDIAFDFVIGYSLPNLAEGGIRDGVRAPLPTILLELKGGALKIRASLDE